MIGAHHGSGDKQQHHQQLNANNRPGSPARGRMWGRTRSSSVSKHRQISLHRSPTISRRKTDGEEKTPPPPRYPGRLELLPQPVLPSLFRCLSLSYPPPASRERAGARGRWRVTGEGRDKPSLGKGVFPRVPPPPPSLRCESMKPSTLGIG